MREFEPAVRQQFADPTVAMCRQSSQHVLEVDPGNRVAIDAVLQVFDVVTGPERLRSYATTGQLANDAEAQLTESLEGCGRPPEGAQLWYPGEESVPTGHPYMRRVTKIALERRSLGWYVISVKSVGAYARDVSRKR